MDLLKRSLAPLTDEAWAEIDEAARESLAGRLSARKFVDVSEPKGWDHAAVPVGRMDLEESTEEGITYGIKRSQPLVESRINFELNIWELDNLTRGAEDVDLDPLEDAAVKAANFEENVIYGGLEQAQIEGLFESAESSVNYTGEPQSLLEAVSEGIAAFSEFSIEGPYALVADKATWSQVNQFTKGYPLQRQLDNLLGGPVHYSPSIENPLLVSTRGGDFELTLGQDFSIGYQDHDHSNNEVKLFVAESFTFRVLEPRAVIALQE